MKKIMNIIAGTLLAASISGCAAQPRNAATGSVKVFGNCEMCKERIEKAAFKKGEAEAVWNSNTKIAVITYDTLNQTLDEILKRIAYAGHDNEKYLAPEDAYAKLPECCRYERKHKTTVLAEKDTVIAGGIITEVKKDETGVFASVFESYFDLKNALVASDAAKASAKAANLKTQLEGINVADLHQDQQTVWAGHEQQLKSLSEQIMKSKKLEEQREIFSKLFKGFSELAKVAELQFPVYIQHCPMYNDGADWLSMESQVKNPYYGSQMLTCGKTTGTIK